MVIYMKSKSLLSNASWSIFLNIWQVMVTFFLTPYLVKGLGLEFYGLLILLLTVSGFMGIMNFGLGDTTLRYVAFYHGKRDMNSINRVISNTFFIFSIISIISFVILYFFSENIANLLINSSGEHKVLFTNLVKITALTISIGFIGGAFSSVPKALQRYDITTKVNIINSILYAFGTVYILYIHGSIQELVIWNMINMLILQIINIVVAKHLINTISILPKFDKKTFKEVFSFSFYTFLIHIFAIIHTNTDKVLTSSMINVSSISYLSISQQLSSKGSQIINVVGNVLLPRFSYISKEDEKKELFLVSAWYLLLLSSIVFLPITVVMQDFLTLWISQDFSAKTNYLAQIITASFIISGSFASYATLFNGLGKAKYMTIVLLLIGSFSLIANFILIKLYGFEGLGYAYWITPIIGASTLVYAWSSVLNQKDIKPLIKIYFIPSIILYILLFVFMQIKNLFIIDNWITLLLVIVAMIVIQLIILTLLELTLNGVSKNIIIFKNILKRLKK